ncbi:formate C-acetyltransferase [Acididesulfobacillus acetoxydans]|uniref:Formate C-acetyltransferase n=1 Tax=Acididesulfobacillus acetoxydans TaxID=1561005 RepID=A0A8S0W6S0_9FIRM|nr:formate C-acetyltransferase [Acididesulfobacillus acetoxydans]CAA7600109.1 formate C-acetyltransferase [Acididesulfobacillus acetoxydans]CEJ07647.1 Formate acetyltransferase 2 [Acididesulfobacillus acetoxydans]
MVSERIQNLKDEMLKARRDISLERASIYTKSYRMTEGEPAIIRRAKATAQVLAEVEISIREGELLAGNRTVKPRSGIASPEMDPYWIYEELDTLHSRPQDKFYVSDEAKKLYREELYPYWRGHSLKDFINARLTKEVKEAQETHIVNLNQTDKGQGHIIMGYRDLLSLGLGNLVDRVRAKQEKEPENVFYQAALITLEATVKHILRYAELTKTLAEKEENPSRQRELLELSRVCSKVAVHKPDTFYEATQLFWFINLAAQYESNASSISPGRFDQYMVPFYQRDRENGVQEEFIKEVLRSLWLKMNDVVLLRSEDSAKYFAGFPTGYTIILGGLDERGHCAVNDLSYLILDTYQDIRLPQPNLGVRINEFTPRRFYNKVVETIRLGTGIPQVFNDEVIIPGFLNRSVSLEEARDYAVVGCVELSIPGKTYGLHDIALFNLLKVMEVTLAEKAGEFDDFAAVKAAIKENIRRYVAYMVEGCNIVETGHRDFAPIPFLSCFVDSCLEKGVDVSAGGAKFNFSGVQGIGTANLSDSLYVIKKLCYEDKRMTLSELLSSLKVNFEDEGGEALRARLIHKYAKYGNDISEVDDIGAEILAYYCKTVEGYTNERGGRFLPGSYTVSAHVPLGAAVGATADGRKAGEQLADGGLSPMVGRDEKGPTAVLKSVSRLDNYLTSNGSLLNVKFHPKALEGQAGINKMIGYLQAFMKLKIQHIQFNIISADTLRAAQREPEKYRNLVVRVAGYSAIFIELNKAIQDDIIARTEHVF